MRLLDWGLRLQLALLLGARLATSSGFLCGWAKWRVEVGVLSGTGDTINFLLCALGWWGGTLLGSARKLKSTGFILLGRGVEWGKAPLAQGVLAWGWFCRVLGIGHERATTFILLIRKVIS